MDFDSDLCIKRNFTQVKAPEVPWEHFSKEMSNSTVASLKITNGHIKSTPCEAGLSVLILSDGKVPPRDIVSTLSFPFPPGQSH